MEKIWTVICEPKRGLFAGTFEAQCSGSVAECIQRVLKDDPVWSTWGYRLEYKRKLPKKSFRRGIAIRFTPR